MSGGTGGQIDGDGVIGELLSDLELAYGEAEFATRHWSAAMRNGRYESAASMVPEVQRAHSLVITRIRECLDVLRVQIAENHRRLREPVAVAGEINDGSPSWAGQAAAIFVMIFGVVAAAVLLVRGFLKG